MALLIGTTAGVFRAEAVGDDGEMGASGRPIDPERTLDCEGVYRLRTLKAVIAVTADPPGNRLYAGTRPPGVYVAELGGDSAIDDQTSWRECEGFARLPKADWRNLGKLDRGPDGAQVRSLVAHPGAPDRVVAGVESVGVFASDDRGRTWERRSEGLQADVHHVCALGPRSYVAACGRGLYRTRDVGRTWVRIDTGHETFWYTYHQAAFVRDGTLYAGAQDRSEYRHLDAARATIVKSGDEGRTFESTGHPGDDAEFVEAWAGTDGRVIAGTSGGRLLASDERGRGDPEGDEWQTLGTVPGEVWSLAAV
ncbi:glycosyl hydrolase [Halobacteriales archaeon QS_1_67_19]|nr:MAG: glycosyl hydrolase [Halobacteriales archaeon QS_1_67_19]